MASSSQPADSGTPSPAVRTRSVGELVSQRIHWLAELEGWRAVLLDLLLLVAVALPALLPLAAEGYLQGSDAVDHPWRSLVLGEALKNGIILPRWSPEFFYGWGFPFFNFYSPLSFYLPLLFESLLHAGLLDATKLAFASYLVLAGTGAYLLARQIFGYRAVALLAGVLYIYSPFTVSEVYVRSNLAGLSGLALLPFVLAIFVRLSQKPSLVLAGVGALLMAILIPSHNVTALVTFGLVAGLVVLGFSKSRNWRALALAGLALVLALGAASFFWAPAIGEKGLVHTEKLYAGDFNYQLHFVDPLGPVDSYLHTAGRWAEPYLQTAWGPVDLHLAYPYGPPPYKLDLFQGLLLLVAAAGLLSARKRPALAIPLSLLAMLLLFLHTSWSRLLWDHISVLAMVQYPWRLTGPAGLCLALLGSWALSSLVPSRKALVMATFGIGAIASSLWMLPTGLGAFEAGQPLTVEGLKQWEDQVRNRFATMVDSQFMPLSVRWDNMFQGDVIDRYPESYPAEGWVGEVAYIEPGSRAWILSARKGYQWMEAEVEAGEAVRLAFHTVYFPGWTAYLDGERVPVEPSGWEEYEYGRRAALGVSEVEVPEGRHLVRLVFEDTPIRYWSKVVSVASLAGIGLVFGLGLAARRKQGRPVGVWVGLLGVIVLGAGLVYWWVSLPRQSEWIENRVVVDVVGEAKARKLEIGVPAGGKADDYVHPRTFTIDGQAREVVYMHPPGMVTRRVWLPEGAVLRFGMGMDPEVWDKPGDGVEFVVEARQGTETVRLFSSWIDPKRDMAQREWIEGEVDLAQYEHQEVELVLRTLPGQSAEYDWAGWAQPRVTLK